MGSCRWQGRLAVRLEALPRTAQEDVQGLSRSEGAAGFCLTGLVEKCLDLIMVVGEKAIHLRLGEALLKRLSDHTMPRPGCRVRTHGQSIAQLKIETRRPA